MVGAESQLEAGGGGGRGVDTEAIGGVVVSLDEKERIKKEDDFGALVTGYVRDEPVVPSRLFTKCCRLEQVPEATT